MQLSAPEGASWAVEREMTLLVRRAQKVRLRSGSLQKPVDRAAYAVLGRLFDAGPQRPGELAGHFFVDASTISRQIAALESAGLIERVTDERDGRAHRVSLTLEGASVLQDTRAVRRHIVHDLLRAWPEADVARFAALLSSFNNGLDQALSRTPDQTIEETR